MNDDLYLVSFIMNNGDCLIGMIDIPPEYVENVKSVYMLKPIRMVLTTNDDGLAQVKAFPFDISTKKTDFIINTRCLMSEAEIDIDEEILEMYQSSLDTVYPTEESEKEELEQNNTDAHDFTFSKTDKKLH